LTSKKNSRSSLKQWVTTIKRYEHELPRLYEKLEYLEVKSIGYNSPSFEPKFGGRGASNVYTIDYWLEKIDACEAQINKREKEISKFNEFTNKLDDITKDIFLKYYYFNVPVVKISVEHKKKNYQLYTIFKSLNKIFNN
jgi:hypothetical protein